MCDGYFNSINKTSYNCLVLNAVSKMNESIESGSPDTLERFHVAKGVSNSLRIVTRF